jgi:hypothetical protein
MKAEGSLPPALRVLAAVSSIALVLAALTVSAQVVKADESSTQTVNQAEVEIPGTEAGAANAGPAIAFNKELVFQKNIQVIAGDAETKANSTQTATNELALNQAAAAASGDASGADGGMAMSGGALAGNIAVVHQMNIQVIAGRGCDVDQIASNTAEIEQTAIAASGDASADGSDAQAVSGNARAVNVDVVRQHNVQVYVCRRGGSGEQVAQNILEDTQGSLAVSGAAIASDGSDSQTGDAAAGNHLRTDQVNRQFAFQ